MSVPGLPVTGSIGVTEPTGTRSAATQSVRRSYEGTTCCGSGPPGNVATTLNVTGSTTETVSSPVFGTYTSARCPLTCSDSIPAPVAA